MNQILKYFLPVVIVVLVIIANLNFSFDVSNYVSIAIALLTYYYVVFTWDMLRTMKEQSNLEKRPYLIADFESPKALLSIYVKNIGKTPAKNVSINISPDINFLHTYTLNKDIWNENIEFFPPNKVVECFIDKVTPFLKKTNSQDKYSISFSYEDYFNNKYNENYVLDLNHHRKQRYVHESDLGHVIESLNKIKHEIARHKD